jgi:hypothetical protein
MSERLTSPLTVGVELRKRGLLGFLWVGWRAVPRGWLER